VAQVDPDDDDIDRWVVRRYAYDPLRHERRHQVVAAFDNEGQFMALLAQSREQLQQLRDEARISTSMSITLVRTWKRIPAAPAESSADLAGHR